MVPEKRRKDLPHGPAQLRPEVPPEAQPHPTGPLRPAQFAAAQPVLQGGDQVSGTDASRSGSAALSERSRTSLVSTGQIVSNARALRAAAPATSASVLRG